MAGDELALLHQEDGLLKPEKEWWKMGNERLGGEVGKFRRERQLDEQHQNAKVGEDEGGSDDDTIRWEVRLDLEV